ncbi:hypothetical protein BDN67DRAFT_916157, partial [Paxillus ammoniavirescens]
REQKQRNQDLPDVIEIVIGMKVMVTQNVKTNLDITNRARGTIIDILLSPDEPTILEIKPITKLQHLPICILVKLMHTRATRLKDLEESVIPFEPVLKTS